MPPDPVKILAVDDVPQNLVALEALLRREGVELLQARSGVEALELLLLHDIAIALLDVQMPGMDGFELAELMRGTERTRSVPIIFLTAVATDEQRRFRGYEAGAVDYLLKPVDPQIVRNKVDIFVELFRQRQELARQRDEHAAALARLNAHSDNSPLAIVELDADQSIIAWSRGAERLFGWRAAEVAGFGASDIRWLHADDADAFTALIAEMIEGHSPRQTRMLRFRSAEGLALDCECYCSALRDNAGGLLSINLQMLDVTDRQRAEETQRLLVGELNHRVKNTLASVQAIATQTLRNSTGPSDFAPTFIGRIHSLASAHSLLSSATWQGASLKALIDGQLTIGTIDADRLHISGPDLDLDPERALHLALVLHELVTNAHKYGALSVPEGQVHLDWRIADGLLELDWAERGGPAVAPPSRKGFGTQLIERSMKADGGSATPHYGKDGIVWKLTLPYFVTVRPQVQPASIARVQDGIGQPHADPRQVLRGKRFIVIEDEPLVAFELIALLEDAGVRLSGHATNSRDARALIAQADADGALLDCNLQGAMVDDIAADLTQRGIPFLFVSGYGRDGLPAGHEDVMVIDKPFDAEQLLDAVGRLTVAHHPDPA